VDVPSPRRRGLGRGHVWAGDSAPSPEIFDILMLKWRIFVESLVLNFVSLYYQIPGIHGLSLSLMEIDLDAIKNVIYCLLLLAFI